MIIQIESTSRRMKRLMRKRINIILSQRSISALMLVLLCANAIMTAVYLRTGTSDHVCIECSFKNDLQTTNRHFPRIFYCNADRMLCNATTAGGETPISIKRNVVDMGNAKARRRIAARDDIDLDKVEDNDCKLRSEWQRKSFPTCNSLHEFDGTKPWLRTSKHQGRRKYYRIIGNGFWRDVWLLNYDHGILDEKGILKTMRYQHSYTPRNFDRMRRDSVTMERLTRSQFIVNIYAFCGTTSLSEFGDGGDIPDALWANNPTAHTSGTSLLTQIDKLRIATEAAIALAAVHNIDEEGYPTIAHTDIAPAQFIKVKDTYKLNDFNRARFIPYRHTNAGNISVEMCPYYIVSNPGRNRSPEEYNFEPQTEKVDVYSLGNIFYMLLQGDWPFYDVPQETAVELVKNGTRPSIYTDLWFSTDPVDVALKEVMIMCHEQNATERASARAVEQYLINAMRQLDHEKLQAWNLT